MPAMVSVPIPNEPGALAKVTSVLAEGGIQVDGVNLVPRGARGEANLVVRDAQKCMDTLQKAGFPGKRSDVVLVTLSNDQGALADMCMRLTRAGINIEALFGTTYGRAGNVALVTDDNRAAAQVLEQVTG